MIRKVRLQGTTYTWVDSLAVEQSLEAPSKNIGAKFLLSFVGYGIYVAALAILVLTDTQVSQGHLVRAGLGKALERFDNINLVSSLPTYITEVVFPLVDWPGEANTEIGIGDNLPTALGAHVLVGALRVVQHRVAASTECADPVLGGSISCAPDYDTHQRDLEARPDAPPFIGPRTLLTFPYVRETFPCPAGLQCTSGTYSRLLSDIFYPDSGYTLDIWGDQLWVNGTKRGVLSQADILNDFFDLRTRYVRVTAVFFNPQLNLFVQSNVHFELPVTGGVFPFATYQVLALVDRAEQHLYFAAEVYLWCYFGWTTLFYVYHLVSGCRRRGQCLRCKIAGKATTVTRCLSCAKPLPTTLAQPEECTWCTATLPAVPHQCWRQRLRSPWAVGTLMGNLLFLVARAITIVARREAIDLVRAATVAGAHYDPAATQLPQGATVLFSPVAQVAAVANDFLAAALVVAFVRSHRYVGRFDWARKFLRVFSAGGLLIGSFFFTFAIVFAGFAMSFYLLLGDVSDYFDSLATAMRTTFFALIMVIDWDVLRPRSATGWIFIVVYVVFVFSCALVMLNTLISVVTYEYKLSVAAKVDDVESKSLQMCAQPVADAARRVIPCASRQPSGNVFENRTDPVGGKRLGAASGSTPGRGSVGGQKARMDVDQASSDVPEQAGVARTVVSDADDGEALALADGMRRDDADTQLVLDALRNVTGIHDVVEAAHFSAVDGQIDELRRELAVAMRFVAGAATRGRSGTVLSSADRAALLGYDREMPHVDL